MHEITFESAASSERRMAAVRARSAPRSVLVCLAIALVTLAWGWAVAPRHAAAALLLANYYLIGLGLAGAFFVALQYASNASWGVAIRRVPEAMSAVLPVAACAMAALLLLAPSLYSWNSGEGLHSAGAWFKRFWLVRSFFLARAAGYLVVWVVLARALVLASRAQDATADPRLTIRNRRISALFLVVFGLTVCLASFDWIMSLEPDWASTIFGLYNFTGLLSSGLAALIVIAVWLRARGPLRHVLTAEHLHDLGKLLFASTTLWMYIWFSQYMLVWYADVPEEAIYFARRWHGPWATLFLLNLALNWVIPFFALLPRTTKRRADLLVKISVVVLLGRWLDLYLMIAPSVAPSPLFGIWDVAAVVAMLSAFGWAFTRAWSRAAPVPIGDPALGRSLHYHS